MKGLEPSASSATVRRSNQLSYTRRPVDIMARNSKNPARRPKARLLDAPGCVGVDEAGRGPLAGPVVCAAVVLDDARSISGLNDSKALCAEQREELELQIKEAAAAWSVRVVSAEEIDRINILRASLLGMMRAVVALHFPMDKVLVDGNRLPSVLTPGWECVIKGDATYQCIAAASILAKVERDRIMVAYADEFPGYGFESHFGYPTPAHMESLALLGPCAIHRRSYGPVRDMLIDDLVSQPCLPLGN